MTNITTLSRYSVTEKWNVIIKWSMKLILPLEIYDGIQSPRPSTTDISYSAAFYVTLSPTPCLKIVFIILFMCSHAVKTNALKKRVVVLLWKTIFFPNIFIIKTFHWYLDIGSEIYLQELLLALASVSSLSCSIICAIVAFQQIEKVVPERCFSLTMFWKHFC